MIKLKDILLEGNPPSIFVPRRMEDRVERLINLYIRNGSKGDLNLHGLHLTVLPDILKDITVGGHFDCSVNKLTSLEGAPTNVGGEFGCNNNNLTSLEGAPKSVGGDFYCNYNKLTSLDGAPKTVGGVFLCNNNLLTSLKGAPKNIGKDFYCSENELTSLEGAPKTVNGDFYCYNNPEPFTERDVRAVCDVKGKVYV